MFCVIDRAIERLMRWFWHLSSGEFRGTINELSRAIGIAPGFHSGNDWRGGRARQYLAFFSLGIGMAVFVTYGSDMTRSFSLPSPAAAIVFGGSLFEILAGPAIFPDVFSFGVNPAARPELAFITLPQVFLSRRFVGAIFFLLLSAAAVTSMVALLEVPVALAVRRLGLRRRSATGIVGGLVFAIGLPSAMSSGVLSHIQIGRYGILDAIDAERSNFLLPISGILTTSFVGAGSVPLATSRYGAVWLWLLRLFVRVMILPSCCNRPARCEPPAHCGGYGASISAIKRLMRAALAPTSLRPIRNTERMSSQLPNGLPALIRMTISSVKPNQRVLSVASIQPLALSVARVFQAQHPVKQLVCGFGAL
jgi:hypothetical protein